MSNASTVSRQGMEMDWQIDKSVLECNKYLLENNVNCDVKFKVGEDQEIIEAHKFMLSKRSCVFEAMFNGSFCESEMDPIIPDVTPAAFKALLRYCYYECLEIEGEVALSVLKAATKYMLSILEKAARKILSENLDKSEILDVVRYSVVDGEGELNDCSRRYLKKNLGENNLWKVYKYALEANDIEALQWCRDYFERDIAIVRKALQAKEFPDIPYKVLLGVMHINDKVDDPGTAEHNPGISVPEIELFSACNTWAEAECQRQKIDPSGANKREVLGECLSLIRFPTMLQKDLMTVVYPTGILTPAEITTIGQYMYRDPGVECQVDFPSQRRKFTVRPGTYRTFTEISTAYIESGARVLLTRVWLFHGNRMTVTVRDESSRRSWSMLYDTKYETHVADDTSYILQFIDIEPQVLEAGTRYSVTTDVHGGGHAISRQSGVQYITLKEQRSGYNGVKVSRDTSNSIHALTLSLV